MTKSRISLRSSGPRSVFTPPLCFDFPSGSDTLNRPSKSILFFRILVKPLNKNIPLHISVNQNYKSRRLIPEEGRWPSSPSVGMGCGGRSSVRRYHSRWTKTLLRTVKSCGPGAATLALSLWSNLQVTVTTSPLTGESTK
jgi:hypothetical protein